VPLTDVRRGLQALGVAFLLAAPSLATLSVWSRHQHIRELQDMALADSTLINADARTSVIYHLSHLQADEALKWQPTGDATMGVLGGVAGLVLILWARRKPAAS
jgi:hypothetical protein